MKGTVTNKEKFQITLEIQKNTFQSQHVSFFLKNLSILAEKTTFYRFSFHGHWALFLSIGKFP